MSQKPLSSSSSSPNLRRLVAFRGVVIAGQLLAVLIAVYGLDIPLPLFPLLTIVAVFAVLNVLTVARLKVASVVTDGELFGHLLLDVAALSALLYLTGGSSNPFVSLFLLSLTMTAVALPVLYTWAMAAITAVCYSVLMVFYLPLPHSHGSDFNLHVLGMWFNFVLSAGLVAWFVVRMGNTVRERDRALAEAREKALRDEQLVALGTLAAGAAHELGTPLATMAVLTKELARECASQPEATDKLRILRGQVDRCKGILTTMAASAGQVRAESGRGLALDVYLQDALDQWQAMRPGVVIAQQWTGSQPPPRIVAEQTLTQAILNILNNAADASPEQVEVQGEWDASELRLIICDRGAGLTPAIQAQAGKALFTTKEPGQGLGMGLFLAHAAIGRFGGSVQLSNREGGGACTRLVLPLTNLVIAP
ncbi:MAG: HAMP domain-containing histidine kinase [Gammaproteobacteria bacterium]|nr:HAMP domain-containing histidine kinase [Gammaproteobacteria bacterium]